jgi:hypothetical protein
MVDPILRTHPTRTTVNDFLNARRIIRGVKPKRVPIPDHNIIFDKQLPISRYNYPTHAYTKYKIWGHRKDPAGIRHPIYYEETLPTTQPLRIDPTITPTRVERQQFGNVLNHAKINRMKSKSLNI